MAKDAYNSLMKIKMKEFIKDNGTKINFPGKEPIFNLMVPMMENGSKVRKMVKELCN